jgi:hypothetical protein
MKSQVLVSVALVLVSTLPLDAQQVPRPGDRVRLRGYCDADGQFVEPSSDAGAERCTITGAFRGVQADSLRVTVGDRPVVYRLSHVDDFAVSQGLRPHTLLGMGIGFVAGSGIAYLIVNSGGSTSLCDSGANQDAIGNWECVGVVALGGAVGAGLGATIGSRIRTERWSRIPLERLRVMVGSRRVGLALAMTF